MDLKKLKKYPVSTVGFFQALAVFLYCGLIALLLNNGNKLFGNTPNYLGPVLFLLIFCMSALICGILTVVYPAVLFFEDKKKSIQLLAYTALWMLLFALLVLSSIVIFNFAL